MNLQTYQKGTGPAVLVQGGGPGISSRPYRRAFDRFAAEAQLFFWDFRGTGASASPGPFDYAYDYQDLKTVVKSLPEKFSVVAHSYGALLGLDLALEFPERVEKLLLVCGSSTFKTSAEGTHQRFLEKLGEELVEEYIALATLFAAGNPTEEEHFLLQKILAYFQVYDDRRNVIDELAAHLDYTPAVLYQNKTYPTVDLTPKLTELRVPVSFVLGENDVVFPKEHLRPLRALLKPKVWVEIKNCGHWPFLEKPAEFDAIFWGFLNDQSSG